MSRPFPVLVHERNQVRRHQVWLCEMRAVAGSVVDDELGVRDPIEQDLLVIVDECVLTAGQQQRRYLDALERHRQVSLQQPLESFPPHLSWNREALGD